MFNLSQLYAYLLPIPPPLHPALCFVQFLVLQAKHSSSFSQNPSRQGPSWLARHFCNNYPSALDLVLALARLRYEDACHRRAALAEAKRREDALAEEQRHLDEAQRREDALAEEERHRAVVAMHRRNVAVLAAIKARQEQVLGMLAKWAKETDEQRRHEAMLAAQTDEQRRHEAVLAAHAEEQRRHEAMLAKEDDERRCHEAGLAAAAADEQRQPESADTVIERIQTEFALCAAPLDAVLAEIANMGGGTQPSFPLAVSPSALVPAAQPSHAVDGQLQTVRPRARPRRCTGRRNIPRAPSSLVPP